MMKKTNIIWGRHYGLLFIVLLISVAFVLGTGTTQAQAAPKADLQKGISAGLVDINNATQKELENIKGVGAVTAKKIIAGRPFKSVDELSKAGLSAKAVAAIKPFVTVGKAQAAAAKTTVAASATAATAKTTAATSAATTAAKTTAATSATATAAATKSVKDLKTTAKSAPSKAPKLAPGTKININTADKAMLEALPDIGPVKAQAIINGRPYKSVEDIMKISGIKQKTFDAIKDYIVVK